MHLTKKTMLVTAMDYYKRGFSIIPIPAASKKASVHWKRYQDERPTEEQISEWFSKQYHQNIAVILGEVSGGLTCRDFDKMEAYEAWAQQHPDLASTLPTVETSQGMHVYFLSDYQGITHFSDGELRGKGGYCLLPPSIHPDGVQYEWIIPLGETIPSLDPNDSGLTEDIEDTEDIEEIEAIVIESTDDLDVKVDKAIQTTCPSQEKERNRKIFQFARYLKGFPEIENVPVKELKPYVRQWHQVALPYITTKSFDETWSDFTYGWAKVKWPHGKNTLQTAIDAALQAQEILPESAEFESVTQKLIRLCYEFQKIQGSEPFWISCRDAGDFMGLSRESAAKRLRMLVTEGILEEVEKHTTSRSTRYRYIALQPVQVVQTGGQDDPS